MFCKELLTFCLNFTFFTKSSISFSGTLGARLVVLKPYISFDWWSEGFKKWKHLQVWFDLKVSTLLISSKRYSFLLGRGIVLREYGNVTCSIFMTQIVLNSKNYIKELTRAFGLGVNIPVGVIHSRVFFTG